MKTIIYIFVFLLCASAFIFAGYQIGKKENLTERDEWRLRTEQQIREELKAKAKKNYESYIRSHGVDSLDVYGRVDWLMSNSAYE